METLTLFTLTRFSSFFLNEIKAEVFDSDVSAACFDRSAGHEAEATQKNLPKRLFCCCESSQ